MGRAQKTETGGMTMRMKHCMALVAALLAVGAHGMGGIEWLNKFGIFESVVATPTNMVLRTSGSLSSLWAIRTHGEEDRRMPWLDRNEEIVLTPDKEVRLSGSHANVFFTPVSFKNQMKGFRVRHDILWGGSETKSVTYLALSDTPVQVGEEDVEMILNGVRNEFGRLRDAAKWKPFEAADKARLGPPLEAILRSIEANKRWKQAPLPSPEPPPEPPPAARQAEPQTAAAEDAQPEAQTEARTLWPYALIPPVLLAALWVARKRRRDSKNCKL